ncbi:hypothetical protein [Aliarcobacter butzleri]|uniref:Uncharacterized protein n=1 Tax=Aliarcobacter butzleri L352 TaxID=1447260 RepID=A0A837J988_9BACT|nr:hypothetical protein [Aliarcobacter butzleri]KLE03617.1 hypothetical protein AF77_09165 [Aliarcobacter butzleri L352]
MKDNIDKVIENFLNNHEVSFDNNIEFNTNLDFDNLDFDTQLQIFLENQEDYEINFEK